MEGGSSEYWKDQTHPHSTTWWEKAEEKRRATTRHKKWASGEREVEEKASASITYTVWTAELSLESEFMLAWYLLGASFPLFHAQLRRLHNCLWFWASKFSRICLLFNAEPAPPYRRWRWWSNRFSDAWRTPWQVSSFVEEEKSFKECHLSLPFNGMWPCCRNRLKRINLLLYLGLVTSNHQSTRVPPRMFSNGILSLCLGVWLSWLHWLFGNWWITSRDCTAAPPQRISRSLPFIHHFWWQGCKLFQGPCLNRQASNPC